MAHKFDVGGMKNVISQIVNPAEPAYPGVVRDHGIKKLRFERVYSEFLHSLILLKFLQYMCLKMVPFELTWIFDSFSSS